MDLASVVAALASVGVRVSGSTPNSSVQVDSSRACPTGLARPEPSGTFHDPGQHFHYGEGMPTAGEAYRAHTARTLSRMHHNQEEVVRRVCYHAVAEVQKEEDMCPRYVWHR